MTLPSSISLAFILLSFTTIFLLYLAGRRNSRIPMVITLYLLIQGILGYFSFYSAQPILPPKIIALVMPSFGLVFYLLFSKKGKQFIETLDIRTLTILHTIRIPVELLLFSLFVNKAIPEVMTFEGRNFDILAGISAPIIYYLTFIKKVMGKKGLLVWNVISTFLLINIIVHATLSVELPFQQFGFEQPNQAILHFPFVWLPSIVVPIVLFSHLAAIQLLLKKEH